MSEQQYLKIDKFDRKEIPDFPGYAVGNDGSVWTCKRVGPPYGMTGQWRKMSPHVEKNGYVSVCLRPKGKKQKCLVHILVLRTFVGPCPSGMETCHENGNRADNRADNLRWGTRESNTADKMKHGRVSHGSKCLHAKLSEEDVKTIRGRRLKGETLVAIASDYGVHLSTVAYACNRKNWKYVE